MAATRNIVDGLWQINLGAVNAFLIDAGELTLIDTGFAGWLTPPPALVAALRLPPRGFVRGVLADGSTKVFEVYVATVV